MSLAASWESQGRRGVKPEASLFHSFETDLRSVDCSVAGSGAGPEPTMASLACTQSLPFWQCPVGMLASGLRLQDEQEEKGLQA